MIPDYDDQGLRDLIASVLDRRERGYSNQFFTMTVSALAKSNGCSNLESYLLSIAEDEIGYNQLKRALMVHYSHFFRDPFVYASIQKILLPLLMNKKGDRRLRIWSAGCSSGEEPYSLAMLLNEYSKNKQIELAYDIFATDVSSEILIKAKKAFYEIDTMGNVPMKYIRDYFSKESEGYRIKDILKRNVHFSRFDLLDKGSTGPPESIYGTFDLVICANVLYYYKEECREYIMEKLIQTITPGGYLVTDDITSVFKMKTRNMHQIIQGQPLYSKTGRLF